MKILYYFIFFFFSNCGIYSFSGSSVSPDVKTVFIDKIPNYATQVNPVLGFMLQDKLQQRFTSETNLKLVNNAEQADIVFIGFVKDYRVSQVTLTSSDFAQLNRLTIIVQVDFGNKIEKSNNYSSSFSRYFDFESTLSLLDIENTAIEDITTFLVDDIFNKAFVNW